MHYLETAAGLKFMLMTDPNLDNQQELLSRLYSQVYVEFVSKNSLYSGGRIDSDLFRIHLQQFIRAQPNFE